MGLRTKKKDKKKYKDARAKKLEEEKQTQQRESRRRDRKLRISDKKERSAPGRRLAIAKRRETQHRVARGEDLRNARQLAAKQRQRWGRQLSGSALREQYKKAERKGNIELAIALRQEACDEWDRVALDHGIPNAGALGHNQYIKHLTTRL